MIFLTKKKQETITDLLAELITIQAKYIQSPDSTRADQIFMQLNAALDTNDIFLEKVAARLENSNYEEKEDEKDERKA